MGAVPKDSTLMRVENELQGIVSEIAGHILTSSTWFEDKMGVRESDRPRLSLKDVSEPERVDLRNTTVACGTRSQDP